MCFAHSSLKLNNGELFYWFGAILWNSNLIKMGDKFYYMRWITVIFYYVKSGIYRFIKKMHYKSDDKFLHEKTLK